MIRRAYLAGPMRGYPSYNFPAFDRARDLLASQGFIVISPADMDRLYEGWGEAPPEGIEFTPDECARFIRRDLEVLLTLTPEIDAIYMLRGWETSKGARAEKAVAEFRGLEVLYE